MTAFAAYLRVYEPLAAFPADERARWEAYLAAGGAPSVEDGLAMEHREALQALTRHAPATLSEHAFVTVVDGISLICPWQTQVRCWEALADFRAELPDLIADAFVPRAVVEQAEQDFLAWRGEHPTQRAHVLSSTWQVPMRWFVLVDSSEREVRAGAPGEGAGAPPGRRTGRSLTYRTAMSQARRRVARSLAVLRRSVDDGAVSAGVEELGRWLEEFHPRSLVELDYGGLVHLLDDSQLAGDESAADVAAALTALGLGRPQDAATEYGRVIARMSALQAVESAN